LVGFFFRLVDLREFENGLIGIIISRFIGIYKDKVALTKNCISI